jgi:hypothetical protein
MKWHCGKGWQMKRKTDYTIKRAKRLTTKRTRRHMARKKKKHLDLMKTLFGQDYNPFSFAQATMKQKADEKGL